MKNQFEALDTVRVAQILFFLDAAIWIALGITSLLNVARGSTSIMTAIVIGVLMFGNAGAMVLSGFGLGKWRGFYYLALAVLLVNIVLTFTDQVGLLDILTFLLDLALLMLLITTSKQYLHRNEGR
ncbi:MAG: hypothetical protein ACK2UI_15610 [Anaerolineae bacterium]